MKRFLITGGAGFIGSTLSEYLLKNGNEVVVIDNFDPYYERSAKEANIKYIVNSPSFQLIEEDICNYQLIMEKLDGDFDAIVHIAAKAGVRASVENPLECQRVNIMGSQSMLEIARAFNIKQFIFASSSSVYGINPNIPWKETDQDMMPISPYASSKLSCELLGHVYSQLYGIRFLALRFFTVFGPRQRPDLAINKFIRKIKAGESIPMYGDGNTYRDYTYIDDVISGILSALNYSDSNFEIINIGNNATISLKDMIQIIENKLGLKAIIDRLPMQPGDVPGTSADISKAKSLLNYNPKTNFEEGIQKYIDWLEINSPGSD